MTANSKNGETRLSLTPKQRKLAETLCDPSFTGTVAELCKSAGVSQSTFYRMQKSEDFKSYVTYLIDSYTDSSLAGVWKSLIRKCNTGDSQSIKLFFELKGKYRQQVDLSGGVVFLSGEEDLSE